MGNKELTFSEYQEKAHTLAIYDGWQKRFNETHHQVLSENPILKEDINSVFNMLHIAYTLFGLSGEVGELLGKMKKIIRDDIGDITPNKVNEMSKELGDTMWYQSEFAKLLDLDMGGVAQQNLDKLFSRKDRGVLGGSGDNR